VVLDHVGEEEPVELRALGLLQLLHLGLGQHARHEVAVHRVVGVGHGLSPSLEPTIHGADLVLLPRGDPLGQPEDLWVGAVARRQGGHGQRLGVVSDHVRHEADVGLGVGITAGELGGRLLGRLLGAAAGGERGEDQGRDEANSGGCHGAGK